MKIFKKSISVILATLLVLSCFAVCSFATDDKTTVKFLSYNVAGLPNIKYILKRDGGVDVSSNQKQLGARLNESDYDVIAVREDFSYHKDLTSKMSAYKNQTKSSGGFIGGDGLNVFSKEAKIFDAKRVTWKKAGGGISDGDILAPKGFMYTVLDFGNGVTVDFYDLHADAFDNEDSIEARSIQYNRIMEFINKNSQDRPTIVTGDFNISAHFSTDYHYDATVQRQLFVYDNGFKDAWIENKNGGDYEDFSSWNASGLHYWGHWDSVEKYYYKNGGGIEIDVRDVDYVNFFNSSNVNISDHSAIKATFTFTKTADFEPDARTHSQKSQNDFEIFFSAIKWFFKDLVTVFNNWDEVMSFLK